MEVRCQHCGGVHRVPRDIFDNREAKIKLSCPSCGKTFHVSNPKLTTLRVNTTHREVSPVSERVNFEGRELRLPAGLELALKVLEGTEKGTVYPVDKPRMTIGRSNADINLNDRETSRLHCALEVSTQGILLRDLDSTNGTTINDVPIDVAKLANGSIFRIGGHLLQLVITPKRA